MKNDERILKLREQIEAKRKEIGAAKKFVPVTNASMTMLGERYNLHTLDKDATMALMVNVNLLRMSADDLELENYKISGFLVEDWIADLKARLAYLETKDERRRLDKLEVELERLLSEEKQTELMLDKIAESL